MVRNLAEFIEQLKRESQIRVLSVPVDPNLEITEIYDRIVKREGPALLFQNVSGSRFPVAVNLFGSARRMAMALGVSDVEEVGKRIAGLLDLKAPGTLWEKLALMPKLASFAQALPKTVREAPCQEVVEDSPDLGELPVLRCWPGDAGRFITLPLVITKDPETGVRNVGIYRMQVFDRAATGMHWQIHKDGAAHFRKARELGRDCLEVAVAMGADPATMFSGACPLPFGIDEFLFAGFLRREPVSLVPCKTVALEVPAESEFVLEGYVDTKEMRREGPFGDHTGYYSAAKDFPVFHVQCMTRRKDPVYAATVVGRPPMEDGYIGKAVERIFLPLLRVQLPEVVDIHLPVQGSFHNCALLAIRKAYPHHAKKAASAIWGLGHLMFEKMVLIFDGDVNLQDPDEVAWRAFANVDPRRDIFLASGPLDELDISASRELYGSKVGVDCTRKWREEGMERDWPPDIVMSDEIRKKVTARWKEYGL